jgi:hypothetical protein
MRIEATKLQLELKIRAEPAPKGALIEFVNKHTKYSKRKYTNRVDVSTQHAHKSYARNF